MRTRTIDAVMLRLRADSFTRRSIRTAAKISGLRMALSMIDLTTLEGADSPQRVRSICRQAVRPGGNLDRAGLDPLPSVAAVCVYPSLIEVAREELAGSGVKVASVATGFPSGQYPLDVRLADVRAAVRAGADEIDMVINRGAFLAGRYGLVEDEIRRTSEACGQADLKIILETGELGSFDKIRLASDLAIGAVSADADSSNRQVFLKTSTGKTSENASLPVTLVLLEAIRDHFRETGVRIGVKPAGGIRSAKTALHYLVMVGETLGAAWLTPRLFRFGASTLINDLLRQIIRTERGVYPAADDIAEA